MNNPRSIMLAGLALALLSPAAWSLSDSPADPASAAEANAPVVKEAWAASTIGAQKSAAAYLTITNPTQRVMTLVGAETPVAAMAEVHESKMEGDTMSMRPVPKLEIDPGETVRFQPGGLHLMLMQLNAPLTDGQQFPLTLHFADGQELVQTVSVRPLKEWVKTHRH